MSAGAIDISVGDITDVEAHVLARYSGERDQAVTLRGVIRGPYCEGVRTLVADFQFQPILPADGSIAMAEAVVTEPCLWSTEMPHVYNVDVEAIAGERIVAQFHGRVGLRRLAPRRPVDFAPGTG